MQQQQQQEQLYVDPHEVDNLLSHELGSMDVRYRNRINEEIHGVAQRCPEETPEMIQESLRRLEEELNRLPPQSRRTYDEAIQLGSTYVTSDEYRLRSLRCKCYNIQETAILIERNLAYTKKYFGTETLLRPIMLSDFSKAEQDMIKKGAMQVLPGRDSAGRRVVLRLTEEYDVSWFKKARYFMYFFQVLSEDVQTQRMGGVFVLRPYHFPSLKFSAEGYEAANELISASPVAMSAVHLLIPESEVNPMLRKIGLSVIGTQFRVRSRSHEGSPLEWQYALASFGISKDQLPLSSTGTIKTKAHLKWLTLRQEKEKAIIDGRPFDGVECPEQLDIFFRRGGNLNSHPGNQMLHEILLSRYDYYKSRKTQKEKTGVAWSIVEEIEQRGGRFLVECKEGYWVNLQDKKAIREKISSSMRDIRKISSQRESVVQMSNSSTSKFLNQNHYSNVQPGNKRQRTDGDMKCSIFSGCR